MPTSVRSSGRRDRCFMKVAVVTVKAIGQSIARDNLEGMRIHQPPQIKGVGVT